MRRIRWIGALWRQSHKPTKNSKQGTIQEPTNSLRCQPRLTCTKGELPRQRPMESPNQRRCSSSSSSLIAITSWMTIIMRWCRRATTLVLTESHSQLAGAHTTKWQQLQEEAKNQSFSCQCQVRESRRLRRSSAAVWASWPCSTCLDWSRLASLRRTWEWIRLMGSIRQLRW